VKAKIQNLNKDR